MFGELSQGASKTLPFIHDSIDTDEEEFAEQIEEREPESTDPEQMAHVQEVLSKLNEAGIEASQGAAGEGYKVGNGGEEWEDASDEEMEE